jgi:hypothetical protein
VKLGLKVRNVSIHADGGGLVLVWPKFMGDAALTMIALAGAAAECRLHGRGRVRFVPDDLALRAQRLVQLHPELAGTDEGLRRMARGGKGRYWKYADDALAAAYYLDEPDPQQFLSELMFAWEKTCEAMKDPDIWDSITTTASLLMEQGAVDGKEVRRLGLELINSLAPRIRS